VKTKVVPVVLVVVVKKHCVVVVLVVRLVVIMTVVVGVVVDVVVDVVVVTAVDVVVTYVSSARSTRTFGKPVRTTADSAWGAGIRIGATASVSIAGEASVRRMVAVRTKSNTLPSL